MSLSVVIVTLNEESNIRECLETVKWADEIIVVDSFSKDGTREIANRYTDKVYQLDRQGFGELKNCALSKAECDWVLSLDADERVTPDLAREIAKSIEKPSFEGYAIPRKAYFLGRWMRHGGWYPGHVVRLFRRERGRFTDDLVHESVIVDGRVGRLSENILHYTDPNLAHYMQKLDKYTSLAALELQKRGQSFTLPQLLHPPLLFLKMYLFRRGFLDGLPGLILSLLSSFYVLLKYAKLWEKTLLLPPSRQPAGSRST